MPALTRRGALLVELLVALTLAGLVGVVMTRLILLQQRTAARFLAVDAARQAVSESSAWLEAELLELGSRVGGSDIQAADRDSLVYRGWRAAGLACAIGPTTITIPRERLTGWRTPQPGRDSIAVYLGEDSLTPTGWRTAPILATGQANCGGREALRMETRLAPGSSPLGPLIPVRVFEVMTLKGYRSLGQWWLGARSVSAGEALQPVAGPFEAGGVEFAYPTRSPGSPLFVDSVGWIDFRLTPQAAQPVRQRLLARNFQ